MEKATVNDIEIEYEVVGAGEPVLFISPVIADGALPLTHERALRERYQLVRYRKRGWGGSTHTPPPVTLAEHAADAGALLELLGLRPAHVVGHSSGASIALQLCIDDPGSVHTLALLEPALLSLPSAQPLLATAAPAFEAYAAGRYEEAVVTFLSAVSGLDAPVCRAVLEENVPNAIADAVADADSFFGVELPAVGAWSISTADTATVTAPVLSVYGDDTEPLWLDVAALLRCCLPHVEERAIEGTGHYLHMQRPAPVARAIAEFLGRHPMMAGAAAAAGASTA